MSEEQPPKEEAEAEAEADDAGEVSNTTGAAVFRRHRMTKHHCVLSGRRTANLGRGRPRGQTAGQPGARGEHAASRPARPTPRTRFGAPHPPARPADPHQPSQFRHLCPSPYPVAGRRGRGRGHAPPAGRRRGRRYVRSARHARRSAGVESGRVAGRRKKLLPPTNSHVQCGRPRSPTNNNNVRSVRTNTPCPLTLRPPPPLPRPVPPPAQRRRSLLRRRRPRRTPPMAPRPRSRRRKERGAPMPLGREGKGSACALSSQRPPPPHHPRTRPAARHYRAPSLSLSPSAYVHPSPSPSPSLPLPIHSSGNESKEMLDCKFIPPPPPPPPPAPGRSEPPCITIHSPPLPAGALPLARESRFQRSLATTPHSTRPSPTQLRIYTPTPDPGPRTPDPGPSTPDPRSTCRS